MHDSDSVDQTILTETQFNMDIDRHIHTCKFYGDKIDQHIINTRQRIQNYRAAMSKEIASEPACCEISAIPQPERLSSRIVGQMLRILF